MEKKLIISFEIKELVIDDNVAVVSTRVIDSVAGEYTKDKGRIVIDSIVKIDGRVE